MDAFQSFSEVLGEFGSIETSPRQPYDENGDNGLILCERYIPEELISTMLCYYVDYQSLLNCQLVCKRWQGLIQDYVWRKKTEMIFGQPLQTLKNMPWSDCYKICEKKPFEKNLVKNHSGQYGVKKHWKIERQGGTRWKVETPPSGVPPLPNDPVFEGKQFCFVTSYSTCTKQQTIDLTAEGLSSHLLDTFQPPIVVGEWYSCRWDCPAIYECIVSLLGKNNKILKTHRFSDTLDGDEAQNQWHNFTYVFENYGTGVTKIKFQHGGSVSRYWAGRYGCKMAGASVVVKIKPPEPSYNSRTPNEIPQ